MTRILATRAGRSVGLVYALMLLFSAGSIGMQGLGFASPSEAPVSPAPRREEIESAEPRVSTLPFDSDRKAMCVVSRFRDRGLVHLDGQSTSGVLVSTARNAVPRPAPVTTTSAADAWGALDEKIMTEYFPIIPTAFRNDLFVFGTKIGNPTGDGSIGAPNYKDLYVMQ